MSIKKAIILIILSLFIISNSFNAEKKKKLIVTKKDLVNFVNITFDELVFNENDFMKMYDDKKEIIIYYDWFEHKTIKEIKNAKIYDVNKNLIMTIIYLYQESGAYEIHFQTNDEKRGFIKVKKDIGFEIDYKFDINYFIEGFNLNYLYEPGFVSEKTGKLYYNNKLVIFYKKEIEALESNEKVSFLVDKDFLESNRSDAGFWTLIIRMIF